MWFSKIAALLILFIAMFTSQACKKKEVTNQDGFAFDKSFSVSSEFDQATSSLVITVHLDKSLHAYAEGEKIGKPMKLEISPKNGWAPAGPAIIPPGTRKNLGALGESVVLEGNVTIKQPLQKGSGDGEALLHLQVCTNTVCDRPRIHALPIEPPR